MSTKKGRDSKRQILLVEDDSYSEMVVRRILNMLETPLEVTSAKTVIDAETSLLRNRYDLIIADIFLDGDATGLDFWQTCQNWAPNVPFVVVSGLPVDQFFRAVGREMIAPPFLPKPFNVSECRLIFEGLLEEAARFAKVA